MLTFDRAEFEERLARCRASLSVHALDALLLFRQESMYYLTGYDTSGYLYFQTLLVGPEDALTLLTRSADVASARLTSLISDIHVRQEGGGSRAAHEIRALLTDKGLAGKRVGIEFDAVGVSVSQGRHLTDSLDGFCEMVDASDLVADLRHVKSDAELDCVRSSARLTQAALEQANELSVPGRRLASIRARALAGAIEGGGDPPGVRWPMAAGETAQLARYFTASGDRTVATNDQVTHEIGVPYRHYYTVVMNTLVVGRPDPRHRTMFDAARDGLDAARASACARQTFGAIHAAYAGTLRRHGFGDLVLNACGYPLAATYPPTWVEQPIIAADSTFVLRDRMVVFIYVVLQDAEHGLAMSLGETVLVNAGAPEVLTHAPRELLVH
jgi:Xaa-Pro dipeptidase